MAGEGADDDEDRDDEQDELNGGAGGDGHGDLHVVLAGGFDGAVEFDDAGEDGDEDQAKEEGILLEGGISFEGAFDRFGEGLGHGGDASGGSGEDQGGDDATEDGLAGEGAFFAAGFTAATALLKTASFGVDALAGGFALFGEEGLCVGEGYLGHLVEVAEALDPVLHAFGEALLAAASALCGQVFAFADAEDGKGDVGEVADEQDDGQYGAKLVVVEDFEDGVLAFEGFDGEESGDDGGDAEADDGEGEDGGVFSSVFGVELHLAVAPAAGNGGHSQEEQGVADDDAGDGAFDDLGAAAAGEGEEDGDADSELGDIAEGGVEEAADEGAKELGELFDGAFDEASEGDEGGGGEYEDGKVDDDLAVGFGDELQLTGEELEYLGMEDDDGYREQEYVDFALDD